MPWATDISPEPEPGFGIYVHWPFCLAKCPYCDFNSHVARSLDESAYAAALVRELEHRAALIEPQAVTSVFFGGGTPSLMAPSTVAEVLEAIDRLWGLNQSVEISLEANPTSVEAEKFKGYAAAGVNRVSLGVQSLNDADLKFLGRLHSADEALAAIDLARTYFARMSFDLIYARPGQTPDAWAQELSRALDFAVDHLSLYQLTIEEGTPFFDLHGKGAFAIPEEESAVALYEVTQQVCESAGLPAYEVSNHAKPGAECRHNLTYWRYGDYVGVGAGAHGRMMAEGRRLATVTESLPGAWLSAVQGQGHALISAEEVADQASAEEMMMMGLRLSEGVSLRRYETLSGQTIDAGRLAALAADGLIERQGDRLRATATGRLVLNQLLAELLT